MSDQSSYSAKGMSKYFLGKNLKKDIPASIVVFLVALPLCLGIALASGAPLFAGILSGIIGGIVVSSISGSQLSVSGPAAGLTVIVLNAITDLGSYDIFLMAIVVAGLIQILLGILKAGTIGDYFPNSVIIGMLAAIGIILILKQLPHAVGYDADYEGDQNFAQPDQENTFSAIISAFNKFNGGAIIISLLSIAVLILWPKVKKLEIIPAPLIVVALGIILAIVFNGTSLALAPDQLVQIPVVTNFADFKNLFIFPDVTALSNPKLWTVAITIAVVASLETLLSLEAVDKIDPIKRSSPTNRELVAQGIGNTIAGLVGALPMTAVIVRSSANVNSGGRTKVSAILHGVFLMLAVLLIPVLINKIPLSCLAAILLLVGYKLAKFSLFTQMWKDGKDQFIPFAVTILAVVFTDLLIGVGVGLAVAIFFLLRTNFRNPYFYTIDRSEGTDIIRLKLAQEVSFLNKGAIQYVLTHMPPNKTVIIDGSNSLFIDKDVLDTIHDYEHNAFTKNIKVELINVKSSYVVPKLSDMALDPKELS
ncbi:SulP family inorganic anion transporter [Pedobacter cryophilus]|uniref:SulP family inorganic anion transporter n=1 Tax=Pedobacter cryophilus TaxID=2571271 RepID=A0A4U1C1R3_9SPHI|nr:SulP family inorganic anion transporter [Pedobacter cryophilus]TKB98927.1 SulP family inorganic anion transporter [Pedobacter cryophilus]